MSIIDAINSTRIDTITHSFRKLHTSSQTHTEEIINCKIQPLRKRYNAINTLKLHNIIDTSPTFTELLKISIILIPK